MSLSQADESSAPVGSGAGFAGSGDLARLMVLFSPSFPIGGFAWSHGFETAIAEGRVSDRASAEDWIAFVLTKGSGWNDAVLFAAAHRAAAGSDEGDLAEINLLALALAGSAERRQESEHLGDAFREASRPWGTLAPVLRTGPVAYAVAAGALCGSAGLALGPSLTASLSGFAGQFISSATRLVPLGQSDAVRLTHALQPVVVALAGRAASSSLDDLGSAALWSDIAAMRHETLQPRLFRS